MGRSSTSGWPLRGRHDLRADRRGGRLRQLSLPRYERALCPTHQQQLLGPDWLDHGAGSPIKTAVPPRGMPHITFAGQFSRQAPIRTARWPRRARDSVKLFALTRDTAGVT